MADVRTLAGWEPNWHDVAFLVAATVIFVSLRRVLRNWNLHLPPGPRPLPLIGNLHQLRGKLYVEFERWGKKYGPLLHFRIGSVPIIVIQNAAYAREFTKVHDQVFANRPRDLLSTQILFAAIGDRWRYMRKVLATEIFVPKRLKTFRDRRRKILLAAVGKMIDESNEGRPVSMKEHLVALMYNIMNQIVAGKLYDGAQSAASVEQAKFRSTVGELFLTVPKFCIRDWFPFTRVFGDFQGLEKRMRELVGRIDAFNQTFLDDHRKAKHRREALRILGCETDDDEGKGDFVDSLLDAHGEDGRPFTDTERKLIMRPLFITGTEGVSTTLVWAIAELNRNPSLMKRVQDEIDSVVGRDRPVQEQDLPQMKLLTAVIKETFRLHPGAPFLVPRQGITSCKVKGYDIPSNARILISLWALGRDGTVWENPLEFRPERFLDPNRPLEFNGVNYEFLPFGSGRRLCPGMNLAVLILQLGLATLLHLCNFSLPEGMKPEQMDLADEPGFNILLRTPLKLFVTPRLAPEVYDTYVTSID